LILQIVAGLSLKNIKPRVWDRESPYFLPGLRAVMLSYADFHKTPASRRAAMERTLHTYLAIPKEVRIYLDNGAFYFLGRDGGVPRQEYEEFVRNAQPDWYPIPQDFIPVPRMDDTAQLECLRRTMDMNRAYEHDGFVPVIHISRQLNVYLEEFRNNERLIQKECIALGGIVPNLLRMPQAMPYADVLHSIRRTRSELAGDNCIYLVLAVRRRCTWPRCSVSTRSTRRAGATGRHGGSCNCQVAATGCSRTWAAGVDASQMKLSGRC
jgi:7-cyano-7-deazaguanine tRNA-ribosyltransferase